MQSRQAGQSGPAGRGRQAASRDHHPDPLSSGGIGQSAPGMRPGQGQREAAASMGGLPRYTQHVSHRMQACVGSGLRACVGTGQAYFLLTAPNNPGREVRQAHRQRTGWAKRTGRVEHEQPEPTGAGAAGGATPRPTTLDSSLRPEVPNEHPMTPEQTMRQTTCNRAITSHRASVRR